MSVASSAPNATATLLPATPARPWKNGAPLQPAAATTPTSVPIPGTRSHTPTPPISPSAVALQISSSPATATQEEYRPSSVLVARNYPADASIALIGIRGTGMSSLAVMACSALGFRLVEADQYFFQATGLSRAAYKSAHGVAAYSREELQLMRSMLAENDSRSVIVCGPGCVKGPGRAWFTEYAKKHPVIYIMRDTGAIQQHLRIWGVETITRLVRLSTPVHRALSSYEFYNLSEPSHTDGSNSGRQSPRSLTLKQVERDFLRLVRGIVMQSCAKSRQTRVYRDGTDAGLFSVPPECKSFTYALSLPLPLLVDVGPKLRQMDAAAIADVVELIIPLISGTYPQADPIFSNTMASDVTTHFYVARRNIRLPIILHIDWAAYHAPYGVASTSPVLIPQREHLYFDLLHHVLRLVPEYLCVDLTCSRGSIRQLVAAKGSTKIIACYYDPLPGDNGWDKQDREAKVWLAEELGCDLVRLCQEARSLSDNYAVQQFTRRARQFQSLKAQNRKHIPIIAYNCGLLGCMSCFLNPILSPVTHPLLEAAKAERPDTQKISALLTLQEAQKALYSSFVLDRMTFGIYGTQVASSMSPAMHNAAFAFCGMPHTYKIYERPTLRDLKVLIQDPYFGGLSVTAPFKREIIPLVDSLSRHAQAIGAVNTVIPLRSGGRNPQPLPDRNRSGKTLALYGENTDWIGVQVCIRRNLSPINAVRRRTTGLVLGAGGMARAAVYALIKLGLRTIFIQNRTVEKASELAAQFNGRSFVSVEDGDDTGQHGSGDRELEGSVDGNGLGATTAHFEQQPVSRTASINVLPSTDSPWPPEYDPPTIILSCILHSKVTGLSSADRRLPLDWLSSPTGGVVIEVIRPTISPAMTSVADFDFH